LVPSSGKGETFAEKIPRAEDTEKNKLDSQAVGVRVPPSGPKRMLTNLSAGLMYSCRRDYRLSYRSGLGGNQLGRGRLPRRE
jgi:hypothetical protein